ncbi:hypothetical protein M407DRAFT_18051 [Tulasnella calospora MUT 4182]|uniref:DUF6533 domain-containing protein n=1 Tax=Tulasnella calospora MUT 4182 TaxID=1051891 RepID=A0A0C3LGV1_9AGAM|nr:hypothetical protein M407DRAFT_18051 [Tulasnella calospora MUT 4182]
MSNSTVNGLDSALVENVGVYIKDVRLTHLATLATATFLVYDVFLTFDDEFDYIWRSRLSYAKAIFLLNRYLTLILFGYDLFVFFAVPTSPDMSQEVAKGASFSCKINGQLAAPASMPNMFFISTIFMMRTYALYERSRLVLVLLVASYVLCFAPAFAYFYVVTGRGLSAEAWTMIADVNGMKKFLVENGVDLSQDWWTISTCISVGVPQQLGAIMVSALVYESGLMFAMVYKLHGERRSRLINRLYLDGMVYYVLMFGTLVGAAVGCYYNSTSRAFVTSRYFVGMKSILCSRMILRLRWYSNSSEAQSPTFGGQEEALATGTDIFFAEADPASGDDWMKNADFGIEIPPGSVLSHGANGENHEMMGMVPVRTRAFPAGGEGDSDLEVGYPLSGASQASWEEAEEEVTLRPTPSASVGADTPSPSRTGFSIRSQEGVAGPSRTKDAAAPLPPEG